MPPFDEDKFAVISDIHGNADALKAVLEDIRAEEIGSIINLGDHVSGPLAARETADILMGTVAVTIRGNCDRAIVESDRATLGASDRAAIEELRPEHLDWLSSLSPMRQIGDIFICHATPNTDEEYWLESVTDDGRARLRDMDEVRAEIGGIDASLFLCGHSHIARRLDLSGGVTIVNPGSIGCPAFVHDSPEPHVMQMGSPTASYAVLRRTDAGWRSSIRAVPYDHRRMANLACQAGRPDWARGVGTGWLG